MDVPVLPVLEIGETFTDDGVRLPTVVVDASAHPAVADLARVHAVEGVGDLRSELMRAGDKLLLGVRLTSPVMATFVVMLDGRHHRRVLEDAARAGSLVIAHTDPDRAQQDRPLWLAVDLDDAALRAALNAA